MARKKGDEKTKRGRPRNQPHRDTIAFPNLAQFGNVAQHQKLVFKPTPRNLRYFSRTPYARRAINAIVKPIAMLDWEITPIKGIEMNSELERQVEVVTQCLSRPNTDDSFRSLVEQVMEDVMLGAGAIEQQTGGDQSRPLWLWPTDGLSIQMFMDWDGKSASPRYFQTYGYGSYQGGGQGVSLRNDELIYIRPNPSTSTPYGYGPLEIAFNSISRLLGVGEFAGNVSSNARPSILLDLGDGYTHELLAAFRQYWRNEVEGQGVTPITALSSSEASKGRGVNVQRLYPEGDKALFLEYQEFLKSEIATAFDLSPQNLGVERDVNRNTSETAEDRDWDQAIKPYADLLASHFTREAIQGSLGFSQLEFRWSGLDREDEEATARIYETYFKNNLLTPDEQRERLGLPPMEGEWGDKTYADIQIAIQAARALGQNLDKDLGGGSSSKPAAQAKPSRSKPKPKGKS